MEANKTSMFENKREILIKAGKALYGERWQTDLARDLGLSNGRRMRQWLSGDRPIPSGLWDDISKLLDERKAIIDDALDTISSNVPR